MRRPFRIKGRAGWQAEFKFADGDVQRRSFADHAAAAQWLEEKKREDDLASGPLFGGPERITLGQFLGEYAARFTIAKLGFKGELTRINHYVCAAGLPRLKAVPTETGGRTLVTEEASPALPTAFDIYREARLAQRSRTYAWIATLARKKVSRITTADIRQLMTLGTCENWSPSTLQKEVALLKAAFNSAIAEWRWKDFKNPCVGIKLGKSNHRFVVMTDAMLTRMVRALAECDNPQVWPLVDLAIHTTLRRDSLLSLRWSRIDFETRRARVWAKGVWRDAQLPLRAVEILQSMPRGAADQVFTMSGNAVEMAWEGVRERAGLTGISFRDLRHVGATHYAKHGLGSHALMHLLGHTTTRMADVYVNLANSDVIRALDNIDEEVDALTPVPPTSHPHGMQRHPRARKNARVTNVFHIRKVAGRLELARASEPEESQSEDALSAGQSRRIQN